MAGIETRLEDAMMKRMDRIEQRLEEVARQGRKEQTDMVVSAHNSSIIKRIEQVVSQKMKRMLPSLVTRGMEGVERDMVTKLGGLENRLAKELVTSQLMEALCCVLPKGVKDFVAPLVSTVQGMGGEFRQMKDMVERMKVEQGAITRKVVVMRAGVTGEEVRDIVRREVVNALDGRTVSKTLLSQM